jgi:hypothetical protein
LDDGRDRVANQDVLSIRKTRLNLVPGNDVTSKLEHRDDGTWDCGSGDCVATNDGRSVSSRVSVDVVVRLGNCESSAAEEHNLGELHCEEANS